MKNKKIIIAGIASIALMMACSEPKQNNSSVTASTETPAEKIDTVKFIDNELVNEDKDEEAGRLNNARRKRPTPPPTDTTPTTPPAPTGGCLFLDFNGHYVTGTLWNTSGAFTCNGSGLTDAQQKEILDTVTSHYRFNPAIKVTTDEGVYNSYPANKRRRCVVTTSWEWYGQTGGVSYINSFTWFSDEPAFVFSSLLNFETKKIEDACSHEFGHTLGLRHQSTWDYVNDVFTKTSEYDWGCCGSAPIMGGSYYQPLAIWKTGYNSIGYLQNDTLTISNTIKQ